MSSLTEKDLRGLFKLLNEVLGHSGADTELFLVGGALMCLAYAAQAPTREVDAVLLPPTDLRVASLRVARHAKVPPERLNDAVMGLVSARADFAPFLELEHLRVMVARSQHLLAMKCLSFRIGAEFHDEDDIRFLLRLLELRSYDKAVAVISRYYPIERFPQKTLHTLAELLPNEGG